MISISVHITVIFIKYYDFRMKMSSKLIGKWGKKLQIIDNDDLEKHTFYGGL